MEDTLARKSSCPVHLVAEEEAGNANGESSTKSTLKRTVSFQRSISIREFNKETTFWQHEYIDDDDTDAVLSESPDVISHGNDNNNNEASSSGATAAHTNTRSNGHNNNNSAFSPNCPAVHVQSSESEFGKQMMKDSVDDSTLYHLRAKFDVVLDDLSHMHGVKENNTMPNKSELRLLCETLIYIWHQEELEQSTRTVFHLVDQGRVRRRFENDWAGYFRFRLDRFPAIPLILLATLSRRPKTFYLESYERRNAVLNMLQIVLNQHESKWAKSSHYFLTSPRCAACDALRDAAMERKRRAMAGKGSNSTSKTSSDDHKSNGAQSANLNGNMRLKRVSSLPVMSNVDRNGSGGGGGGRSLADMIGGLKINGKVNEGQQQQQQQQQLHSSAPEAGPQTTQCEDDNLPTARHMHHSKPATTQTVSKSAPSRAGKARNLWRSSMVAIGQLIQAKR